MFGDKYSGQSEKLEAFFGERVETLSRATGFVRRRSKLTGTKFVQALVLSWLDQPKGSLTSVRQTCQTLGVDISEAGLQQRITGRAVNLLRQLFEEGLREVAQRRWLPEGVLAHFRAVYVLDSTTVRLPHRLASHFAGCGGKANTSSAAAAVKVRLSLDYVSGSMAAVEVVAGRSPDQTCQQHVLLAQPGSLHVFDLGFFNQQVFAVLAARGAFFVSRWQPQTSVYVEDTPLDVLALLEAQPNDTLEVEVEVKLGRLTRLPVRLIAHRLPPDQVARRRRKAIRQAQKHGDTCSARHLAFLAWALLITNIPAAWLSAEQIGLVYRVRWQVELVFKLWKSQACLDVVGQCGLSRFLCQLYARLLGLLIFHWLLAHVPLHPRRELSLPKAFALFQRAAAWWALALAGFGLTFSACLARFVEDVRRFAFKQQRRTQPSTLARLLASHV